MNREIAVELSNLGVCFLDVGDVDRAHGLFRDALQYTIGELNVRSSFELTSYREALEAYPSISDQESHTAMMNHSREGFLSRQRLATVLGKQDRLKDGSFTFIHMNGINLIGSPVAYSNDVLVNTTIVSSVIIFNLAVVYHLQSLIGGNCIRKRLQKALSLYRQSRQLLIDAGVGFSVTGNPGIDLLSMAVLNNTAHVCYELVRYDETKALFDELVVFTRSISSRLYRDGFVGAIIEKQKSSYLLNAIILSEPGLASAA